jgi:uncharacterized membrane protein YphA (DoxX/SURF4 family)
VAEIGFTAALVVGAVLVVSGVGKLRDPSGFVLAVLDYEVLPRPLATAYARTVPLAEIVCGPALLAGIAPMASGALAAALLTSFLIGVSVNLARGRDLDCHCFGPGSSEPLGWTTLARISILLACAGLAVAWRGSGALALLPHDALPCALLTLAVLLALYVGRAIPEQWAMWQMRAPEQWREPRRGRMVFLHIYPVVRRLGTAESERGGKA